VLFELLSGKRAFPGKTSGEIMAAVLLQDPDYTQLPAGTPESLQRLIARCLAKEPVKRPASATEVLQTLKKVVRAPSLDTGRRGGGWLEDADASENPLDIPPSISVAAAAPAEAHRSVVTSKPPAAAGSAPGSPQSSASGETEPPARRGDTVHLTELAPGSGAPAKHVSQLEPALLNVLVQCACFAGSFAARDAVEVLGNTAGTASVLARLSECGLLGHENAGENERLFVPSALRAYIQQLYRDDEALAGAHRRLINHLALWSVRMRKLMEGPAQARSLQEIDACVDTIAGSLAWSQATGECAEDAVLVVANLREYWEVRGRVGYARTTLERALDRGHLRLSPLTQALGLSSSGALAHIEGDMVEAVTLQRKALAQMRKLGEEEGTAECLLLLGVALILKEPLTSRNMLQEAIDLGNKLDRRDFVARGCLGLSFLALQSASMIDAQRALLAVSTVKGAGGSTSAQSAFSPRLSAQIQTMWGFLKLLQNEPSEAERLVNEGLALLTQIDDQPGIGLAHCQLGKIDLHNRQLDKAEAQLESGLAILRTVRDKLGVLRALGAKAHLMGERGHHRDALTLWLACERVRTEIMLPISPAESLLNQRWLARTVQALGETGVKAAEKAAAAMTWLQMNE
jgi:tetratricopeptide (TPR) repeat protein